MRAPCRSAARRSNGVGRRRGRQAGGGGGGALGRGRHARRGERANWPASANRARSSRLFSPWPERWPEKRPRSGAPASARSPTTSSSLCRTNSSGRRSPPGFSTSGPSTTTALARLPPRARPAARSAATSSARVKVRASASAARKLRGDRRSESDCRPMAVAGKSMVREASKPLRGRRRQFGPGRVGAVAVLHPHRAQHLDRLDRGVAGLGNDAGAVDQEDEGRGGAVQDGHFRAVDLDQRVVHAAAGQRRHHVLDRGDAAARVAGDAERGAEPGVHHVVEAGGDVEADVGAAEHDAGPGGRRPQGERNAAAAVQADADAADGRLQRAAATRLDRKVTVHSRSHPLWNATNWPAPTGMRSHLRRAKRQSSLVSAYYAASP